MCDSLAMIWIYGSLYKIVGGSTYYKGHVTLEQKPKSHKSGNRTFNNALFSCHISIINHFISVWDMYAFVYKSFEVLDEICTYWSQCQVIYVAYNKTFDM